MAATDLPGPPSGKIRFTCEGKTTDIDVSWDEVLPVAAPTLGKILGCRQLITTEVLRARDRYSTIKARPDGLTSDAR